MRFEQALQAMREGNKVKLEEEPTYYIKYNTIIEKWENICEVSTLLNPEQILSDEWEILDDNK